MADKSCEREGANIGRLSPEDMAEALAADARILVEKKAGEYQFSVEIKVSSNFVGVNALSNLIAEYARASGMSEKKLLLLLMKGAEGEEVQEA